jgi:glycosyltransferase involved in cell wall biosynthesis
LAQEFKDFELILIDDGSKDGSKNVCEEYAKKDERIKFYRFEENSGLPAKRYNDGMLLSQGEYFTFMFDDDKWYPNALTYLYNATQENPEYGMIYGLTNYMNVKTGTPLQLNFGLEWSWDLIDKQNFLCNNSVIVKREVIDVVGGYDEDPIMRRLCDWDLWWRIGRGYKVKRILKLIGEVHAFHDDSIGVTVQYDINAIRELQTRPNRKVRLLGELKKKV